MKTINAVAILLILMVSRIIPSHFVFSYVYDLFLIPTGYRTFFLNIILLLLLVVVIFRDKNFNALMIMWSCWLPWIVYLACRTNLTSVGIHKYELYVMVVYLPSLAAGVFYMSDRDFFNTAIMKILLYFAVALFFTNYLIGFADASYYSIKASIDLSRALGIVLVYNLYLKDRGISRANYLWIFFISALLFIGMILLGARGPVISVILTVIFYYLNAYKKNFLLVPALLLLTVSIAVFYVYIPKVNQFVVSFMTHGNRMKIEDVANNRIGVYVPSIKIFARNIFFGTGLGGWGKNFVQGFIPYFDKLYYQMKLDKNFYIYPHNIILEVMAELGLVGVLLFVRFFLPVRRWMSFDNRYNILVLLNLLYAMTSHDLVGNSALMLFLVLSFLEFRNMESSAVVSDNSGIAIK